MAALTCFVVDCNLPNAPPIISDLTLGGQPISAYFQNASGAADLGFTFDWSRRGMLSPSSQSNDGAVSQDELLDGLARVLGTSAASNRPSVALMLAGRYDQAPGQYGFMFDVDRPDGLPGYRQGCALFLQAIWTKFFLQPEAARDAAFREAVAYIAVHELGHVFNLWHEGDGDNSFMKTHPTPERFGDLCFNTLQRGYLALAVDSSTAAFVIPGPGCEPFGTLAPGFSSSDSSAFAGPAEKVSGLEFRVALSHDSFWSFEPIELDLELHLPQAAAAPIAIPDEIDPGYSTLRIWITRPDGERFRYRPQTRFCSANGERAIMPGGTIRRDIAITRQSGGYTFTMAGEYQVEASFHHPSGGVLLSNSVTCEVLRANPASGKWIEASRVLQNATAQRLLRFKRWVPSHYECARLARFADDTASPATSAAIDYALGKSLLRMAERVPHDDYSRDLRRRGASHLKHALDGLRLSPHRADITTNLLDALSEQ